MDRQKVGRQAVLGGRAERLFQPDLSVGQVQGNPGMLRPVSELQAGWQPVRFVVAGVELIWRGQPPDEVFRMAMKAPQASG